MMLIPGETHEEWKTRVSQWHRWFAWRPVWTNGPPPGLLWLETIECRMVQYHSEISDEYEYRRLTG